MNEPDRRRPYRGVLCIPLQNENRQVKDENRLKELRDWVTKTASEANIDLKVPEGEFDEKNIVSFICKRIRDADIVVSVVWENNPNVLFESGYVLGWEKPLLYIVKEGERVPFDISGVEQFRFSSADEASKIRLLGSLP
jgi:hypothetical protein